MAHKVSSIKERDAGLAGRIKHMILEYEPAKKDDESCFHLNYTDDTYDQEEFARLLWATLPLFALSPLEYEDQQLSSPSEMQRTAYGRITKNDSMSDYGELLLFVLLDYFFDTPKFVTKVRARTSDSVPAFGSDCAHVSFNEQGGPVLWLGEAKFMSDFSGALDDAFKSVSSLLRIHKLQSELRLLDPHIEANQNFSEEFLSQLKEITRGAVPIGAFDINIPILLITDSGAASTSKSLEELRSNLEKECQRRFEIISKRDWPTVARVKFHFILFPLSNKGELVKNLKAYIA